MGGDSAFELPWKISCVAARMAAAMRSKVEKRRDMGLKFFLRWSLIGRVTRTVKSAQQLLDGQSVHEFKGLRGVVRANEEGWGEC